MVTSQPNSFPVDFDSTTWIVSCTKLVMSVAALRMVEKGLVGLDEDIGRVLTEWKSPGILEGFEEDTGRPILKNKMTLRYVRACVPDRGFGGL